MALSAAWLAGCVGLAQKRRQLRLSLQLFAFVLLPYLAFFWLFNPGEMLLYSAPLAAPVLAWLFRGWENIFNVHRLDFFLLALAFIFMLHNGACLATYP